MATARGKVTSIHCGFPASEFQHVSGSPSIALPGPYSFELRCRIDDARMLALSRDDNNDVHAVAAIRAGNILHDTRFSCVSGRFVLVCALGSSISSETSLSETPQYVTPQVQSPNVKLTPSTPPCRLLVCSAGRQHKFLVSYQHIRSHAGPVRAPAAVTRQLHHQRTWAVCSCCVSKPLTSCLLFLARFCLAGGAVVATRGLRARSCSEVYIRTPCRMRRVEKGQIYPSSVLCTCPPWSELLHMLTCNDTCRGVSTRSKFGLRCQCQRGDSQCVQLLGLQPAGHGQLSLPV